MVMKKIKTIFKKKTVKKAAPKPAAKKSVAKKAPAKKAAPKKAAVKKAAPKRAPAKKAITKKPAAKKTGAKQYENRFQKFYDLNKSRINKDRRSRYKDHMKKGLCVRCSKKALKGIKLCKYHKDKQREYNKNRK